MVFTDYLFNLFGYSGPKSWFHHHLNFFPAAIVSEHLGALWFKITSPSQPKLVAKALNQIMPWQRFELNIKEDDPMGGWLIFIFGGVMGFCLGVVWLILMITVGESEMGLAQLDAQEQSTKLNY